MTVAHAFDTASSFKHSLIKPNGLGDIADGAEVVRAELVLEIFNTGDTVQVREILGQWSERSVTWNSAPALGPAFASFSGRSSGRVAVDVTALMQDWVDGAPILGLDLYPSDDNGVDMRSTEYGTASQRPHFVVEIIERVSSCADADGDGFADAACGGVDCNDRNGAVNPAAAEVCGDGVDNGQVLWPVGGDD